MAKDNMSVSVNVTVAGTIDSNNVATATATYSGSSTPGAKNDKTVVGSDGQIDLTAIDRDKNKYKKDVDIVFYLGGEVTDSAGNSHGFGYPVDPNNPNSAALALEVTGKHVEKFSASLDDDFTLLVNDQDDDGDQYHYTLKMHIEPLEVGGSGWTIPIDPIIINRGIGD